MRQRVFMGAGLPAAAEASLNTALIGQVRVVRRSAARNATLEAVARIFGSRIEGEGTRDEVARLRARAEQLVEAGQDVSTAVAVAYASDLFVLCAIERRWRRNE